MNDMKRHETMRAIDEKKNVYYSRTIKKSVDVNGVRLPQPVCATRKGGFTSTAVVHGEHDARHERRARLFTIAAYTKERFSLDATAIRRLTNNHSIARIFHDARTRRRW